MNLFSFEFWRILNILVETLILNIENQFIVGERRRKITSKSGMGAIF